MNEKTICDKCGVEINAKVFRRVIKNGKKVNSQLLSSRLKKYNLTQTSILCEKCLWD